MFKPRVSAERSKKRQGLRFSAIDFHATSCVIDLVLRDLNSEGMSIETRQSLRVGARYPFKIRRGHHSAEIDGTVVWCKLLRMIDLGGGESQALFRAGIAFSRRLEEFPPVRSIDAPAESAARFVASPDRAVAPPRERSATTCPNCRVPAVPGAQRCRICGTILPQT